MRFVRRAATAALIITTAAVGAAAPAWAAAPGNDTYAGRTVVSALPFSESVDTSQATTDADDVEINADCGAPATDASVWYELTATEDGAIAVDVSASNYSAGVLVATGSPGSFQIVACAPGAVAFSTVAGETYAILAIDDQFDGAGNGGMLSITIDNVPPPPTVDVTVDPVGRFVKKTGSAIISGTLTCTGSADPAFIDVTLTQAVGRFSIRGIGFTEAPCDGATHAWSAEITPENGKFAGGKSVSVTFAIACGPFECGFDFEERVVRLRG